MTKTPPHLLKFLHIFLFLCLPLMSVQVNSQFSAAERATLLHLKRKFGNPPGLQHWNASSSPCDWPEVICSPSGDVFGLDLSYKNITEPIPASICDLKNLEALYLYYNYIPGEFPRVLYNCSKLLELDLSQNYFVGRIPADIDRISTLTWLNLGANNFTGDIPPAIGRLQNLQGLLLF